MALDMFLKIDGIQGESMDNHHKDEIDILSYTWGESQPAAAGSGAGAAAGRVTMQDFHFTMRANKASPKLFLACANGALVAAYEAPRAEISPAKAPRRQVKR